MTGLEYAALLILGLPLGIFMILMLVGLSIAVPMVLYTLWKGLKGDSDA